MYTYEASMVLKGRAGTQYEDINLEFASVSSIYNNYYKVYLILSNPYASGPVYVDMSDLKESLSAFIGTVSQFLIANGGNTIPSVPSLPNPDTRFARYTELTKAGYEVSLGVEGLYYPTNMDRANLKDLVINRQDTPMSEIQRACLITVNGYVHWTTYNGTSLYVRDGGISCKLKNQFTAGLISFNAIGDLTRHRLDALNIKPFESNFSLKEKIRIKVPGVASGKAFFLVMGGYMIFPQPGVFFQVSEDEFALDIQQLGIIEKLLESADFIDLRGLELTQPDNMSQPGWLTEELLTDLVIKRYLTLSQSFFVTVDSDNLTIERSPTVHEPYPGRYLVSSEPVDPLIGGHGRLIEYWPLEGKSSWIIDCHDNYRRNYASMTYGPDGPKVVDQTEDITNRHRLTGGYLLQISSTV